MRIELGPVKVDMPNWLALLLASLGVSAYSAKQAGKLNDLLFKKPNNNQ